MHIHPKPQVITSVGRDFDVYDVRLRGKRQRIKYI